MEVITVVFMVFIGAAIGWITNILAIKLLFRPIKPFRIPLIGYEIQGLLPRRKAEVAANIGKTVEEELISINEILDKMVHEEDKDAIIKMVKRKILTIADENIPFLIPSSIKNMIISSINDIIDKEMGIMLTNLSETLIHKATSRIKVREIVEEKINSYEFEKIEAIVLNIAKKELKHIERLGGLLGGIIGLVQGLVVILLRQY